MAARATARHDYSNNTHKIYIFFFLWLKKKKEYEENLKLSSDAPLKG